MMLLHEGHNQKTNRGNQLMNICIITNLEVKDSQIRKLSYGQLESY